MWHDRFRGWTNARPRRREQKGFESNSCCNGWWRAREIETAASISTYKTSEWGTNVSLFSSFNYSMFNMLYVCLYWQDELPVIQAGMKVMYWHPAMPIRPGNECIVKILEVYDDEHRKRTQVYRILKYYVNYMHVYVCMYMYVCTYVCMHVYVCTFNAWDNIILNTDSIRTWWHG